MYYLLLILPLSECYRIRTSLLDMSDPSLSKMASNPMHSPILPDKHWYALFLPSERTSTHYYNRTFTQALVSFFALLYLVEYENYCKHTRVEEIMDFAKKINAKKIGIATCVGLLKESRILADILRRHGFDVYGVACKAGTQKKTSVGIPECCEGVGVNMCNPILQAKLLNKAKTDLNVVVGLCVGHDSLFYKYSEALTTTAVTKDRVLGHNPVAALYTADSYYSKLKKSEEE